MKYPIGIQDFEDLRRNGYKYVDKTNFVYKLADEGKYYFLSRPRRFGKSLFLSTLEAYFQGKKELFEGLAIYDLETEWKKYPIFHIDLNTANFREKDSLYNVLNDYLTGWEDKYGARESEATLALRFKGVIARAAEKEGCGVVILIDEYDKPILQTLRDPELQAEHRAQLKAFYSVLKTQDRYIKFAFLTGVTKFGKVSVFSDLNNLTDISMDHRYISICGMTEKELLTNFKEGISELAEANGDTEEATIAKLKARYDGYHFEENTVGLYNPFSVLNTLSRLRYKDYWFETGTPTFLVDLLKMHNYRLPDMTKERVSDDVINSVDSLSTNPIPVIYQSGYLTIKGYDKRYGEYTLDYPNVEVAKGFVTLMANSYLKKAESEASYWIVNLDRMLRRGALDDIKEAFTAFLASIPYEANKDERAKNFETHFQYTFYIIFRLLSCYTTLIEKQNSKGRADIIVESDNDIYIFEFKMDGTAEEALKQIEEKQYALPYLNDKRSVHKIGVNISSSTRTVDGWLLG